MGKILKVNFFNRDTEVVAQELLGKLLVRRIGEKEISAMITETEAYDSLDDLASHASKGRTGRTEVMFGKPGNFYVYLVYGMYFMLNVVTREKDYPAAVLIRGVKLQNANLNGPGKITNFFKIDKNLNSKVAGTSSGLWFEDRGVEVSQGKVKKLPRVGVAYAGPVWSVKKRRFLLL